ncbi:hypothetical protein GCM10009836_58880 [Pseudonocardia ailaonensis]|uniref:Type II secretion system protein GspF domain-containing protein n=1 Tax=Pseudonocardia ailaonensis TaxID=367279 RepID=A0ABN2NIA4_9PSEU
MNSGWSVAAAALAGALLLVGSPGRPRLRSLIGGEVTAVVPPPALRRRWLVVAGSAVALLGWVAAGGTGGGVGAVIVGLGLGGATGAGLVTAARRVARPRATDPGGLAAGWELLATCLDCGLPVTAAAEAAAIRIDGEVGAGLRRAAGLLELGSAPGEAWQAVATVPGLEAFGRAALRSADTGAGLARVARAEATRLRAGLSDAAEAKAERAAVLVAAPLGLCFLPAFLALGIAPVVIGLAGEALARW